METTKKSLNKRSVILALIFSVTYMGAVWLLQHEKIDRPLSIFIALVPIITFSIFMYTYIKNITAMDEVNQRVQFEAVVIGFALTLMLLMLLFLLSMCNISNLYWFGYAHLVMYSMMFYLVGYFISKKKYAI